MATKQEKWQEIADRGLQDKFDPETRAKFDEAVNRGLITLPTGDNSQPMQTSPTQAPQQFYNEDVPRSEGAPFPDQPVKPERSFGDIAEGVGEAALTIGTGATTGALGFLGGSIEAAIGKLTGGLTEEEAVKLIQERSSGLTNMPESEAGQEYVKFIGDKLGALPPVLGTGPVVGLNALRYRPEMPAARRGSQASNSVGAAQTDLGAARGSQAQGLPVPIALTKGQKTQDLPTQRFERETAKTELGGDLRARYVEQNEQVLQNIDAFIDETGTKLPDQQSAAQTGTAVDLALRNRAAKDKTKIRNAYKIAENSKEANELVDISNVAKYLDENSSGMSTAPIMKVIESESVKQGYGSGSISDGTFNIGDMTLKQSEGLRKVINKFTKGDDANDIRVASEVKGIIDESTKDSGGAAYKRARGLRSDYAKKYERVEIIKNLLGKKRGSDDRKIALEQVKNKIVDTGTVADLKQVKRLLTSAGEEGKQAFREIQAQTIKDFRESITSNVGRDPNGNPVVSAAKLDRAIKALDQNGKLDILFTSDGADQLRFLNDVAKDVFVSQPGAVNYSNTSTAIVAALDLMGSAFTGVPLPLAIAAKKGGSMMKERKTKKLIKESLD